MHICSILKLRLNSLKKNKKNKNKKNKKKPLETKNKYKRATKA